jgi:hypothetical protein
MLHRSFKLQANLEGYYTGIAWKNICISVGNVEVPVHKGKTGDISFDFNAPKAYDNDRFALVEAAVLL